MTPRALAIGFLVGTLLCATTLFVGLKVGFTDSGNIVACLLGFALGRTLLRGRTRYSVEENQITHSLAACMAGAPIATGLLTVVPGLELLGASYAPWALSAWGIAIGLAGIGFAYAWRGLLAREQLRFPTGIAAAELVSAIHASAIVGAQRARSLLTAAGVAGALTWLRDLPPRWLPAVTWAPGELQARTVGIAWSPLLIGLGGLVGVPVALAALAGSLIAWGGLAPAFGPAAGSFGETIAWVAWPATALLVTSSLPVVATAMQRMRIARVGRRLDPVAPRARRDLRLALALALALALIALAGTVAFDAPWWLMVVGALLAPIGGLLCAHAAGEIDISPHGVVANLGIASVGHVGAGAAVGGVGYQVPTTLWALRAGERLGTPLVPQLVAQVVGVVAGVAIAVPLYGVLVAANGGIGSEALPAAGGQSVRAFAELVRDGGGVASSATAVAAIALAVGAIILSSPARRWISVAGLGVGMLLPVHYAAAIALGAGLAALYRRVLPGHADRVEPAAAGLVVGESSVGVIGAVAGALG